MVPPSTTPSVTEAVLVVHPDVAAVIAGGRVEITLYDEARATVAVVESDDPALAAVLHFFAKPASVGALLARVTDVDAGSLIEIVEALRERGMLLDARHPTSAAEPLAEAARDEHEAASRSARALARLVADIADDLDAFGPLGSSPPATDASAVTRRLRFRGPGPAARELAPRSAPPVSRRAARTPADHGRHARAQAQVGAANRPIPGWLNVDLAPADLALDLR